MENIRLDFVKKTGDKSDGVKRQIISLGSGFDTFVFDLMANSDKYADFSYFEIDVPVIVKEKVKATDPGSTD